MSVLKKEREQSVENEDHDLKNQHGDHDLKSQHDHDASDDWLSRVTAA